MKLFSRVLNFTILLSFVFSIFSFSASAQRLPPEIEKRLKDAPPELLEILKNLPPSSLAQLMKDNEPKGKQTFQVIPSGSALGVKALGVPLPLPPLSDAMRGGTIYAVEVGKCGDTFVVKNMYVLFLNKNRQANYFTANQIGKTAKLNLQGEMHRWQMDCETKEFRKAGVSLGGIQVDFKTTVHLRPRMFQVLAGKEDVRGEYIKQVREAQQFYLKNLANYYRDIGEYMKKPRIDLIKIPDYGDVGGIPPAPTGMTDDARQAVATGQGLGNALRAVNLFNTVRNPVGAAQAAREYIGDYPGQQLTQYVESMVVGEATAEYQRNMEVFDFIKDPQGYMFDKGVQGMIEQVAAVNKQYAEQGDPVSQQIQKDAQKQMRHKDKPYSYVDADYMSGLLVNAFENELKRLEAERELEKTLPPTSASGRIWGAGLWQSLQVFAQVVGEPVAVSYAPGENKSSVDPNVLAALKKAGYPVPDQIPEPKYADANIEFDATKPYFHGRLSGTKMMHIEKGVEYPELVVMFSVSSPEEAYKFKWEGTTIFDPPFIDNGGGGDDDKKDCKFYVATNGSDANSGTMAQPFATIQHALDEAKVCRDANNPAEIIVRDGVYRQTASVNWSDTPKTPALSITGETPNGAVFSATEISNASWENAASGFQTNMPLHPEQPAWTPGGSVLTNPPPVVVVNNQRLIYVPLAKNLPAPGTYKITGNTIYARPPENASDLNSETVEVGVRPFALKFTGARNVTVNNIVFRYFPRESGAQTPGLVKTGSQINCQTCVFE